MSERREEESDGLTPLCAGDPLAGALARLAPVPPGFDRDALLYAAGGAARAGAAARWRYASAAAVLVAAGAWGFVLLEPAEMPARSGTVASKSPDVAPKAITPPSAEPSESPTEPLIVTFADEGNPGDRVRGLRLRNDILLGGLGMIPSATRPGSITPTSLAEVERSLGLPAGTFAVPIAPMPKPKSDDPD